jgi:hypothetical protein
VSQVRGVNETGVLPLQAVSALPRTGVGLVTGGGGERHALVAGLAAAIGGLTLAAWSRKRRAA